MDVTAYCRPVITGFMVRPLRVSVCGSSCASDGRVLALMTTTVTTALSRVRMSYLMEDRATSERQNTRADRPRQDIEAPRVGVDHQSPQGRPFGACPSVPEPPAPPRSTASDDRRKPRVSAPRSPATQPRHRAP